MSTICVNKLFVEKCQQKCRMRYIRDGYTQNFTARGNIIPNRLFPLRPYLPNAAKNNATNVFKTASANFSPVPLSLLSSVHTYFVVFIMFLGLAVIFETVNAGISPDHWAVPKVYR